MYERAGSAWSSLPVATLKPSGRKGYSKGKFTFFQKLLIAEMLGLFSSKIQGKMLFDAVVTINEIRNKLTHVLKVDESSLKSLFEKHPELVQRIKDVLVLNTFLHQNILVLPSFNVHLYKTSPTIEGMIEVNNSYAVASTKNFKRKLHKKQNFVLGII